MSATQRVGPTLAPLLIAVLSFGAMLFTPETNADAGANAPTQPAAAQPTDAETGTITGEVADKATGHPLVSGTVQVPETSRRTMTDSRGGFLLSGMPQGRYTLVFGYIGYAPVRRAVTVTAGTTVNLGTIEMEFQPFLLDEVVVTPGSYTVMGDRGSMRQTLSSEDIQMMGWAEDITRAVQRIPGTSSDEYAAQFSVRGGETDEILVLLDGMQIYRPFHQKDFGGGLLSTVDIETIDHVDLLTGGFTADYGDRMSGVLNMKTKSPKPGGGQTSIGLSLMNLRALSLGTLGADGGSWLLSGRRAYLDLLDRLMGNTLKIKPNYYDLLGKVALKLNHRHTLSVHGLLADDSYKLYERVQEPRTTWFNTDIVHTKYGNAYGWLTLESFLSARLRARTMLSSGRVTQDRSWEVFDNDPQYHLNSATLHDERDLGLLGLKQDWDYQASPDLLLKLGVDAKRLHSRYDYSNEVRNEFITAEDSLTERATAFAAKKKVSGNRVSLYVSNRVRVVPRLALEAGLRYDHASYSKDNLWSPRLGAVYSLADETFLRAGWGYFYQPQDIDDLDIQFRDLSYHPAEMAEHFVLGFEHLFHGGVHARVEGYYKRMSHLRDTYYSFRDIDEFFPEVRDDLIRVSASEATSRGVELLLKRDTGGRVAWWLSYVLADARDDVSSIDYDGNLVKRTGMLPRAWDQRHTLRLDTNYRLNKSWQFNAAWQFRTGWPSTDFTVERKQREDGSFAYYHDQGLFRGNRVPAYHRLDARINRHFYTSRGKVSVFLHVLNLYNHENVIRYDHEIVEESADGFRAKIVPEPWFGILPFVGVSWEF